MKIVERGEGRGEKRKEKGGREGDKGGGRETLAWNNLRHLYSSPN